MSWPSPLETQSIKLPEDIGSVNNVRAVSGSLYPVLQPYKYKPLKEGEVRLLDLLPGTEDNQSPVSCHLYDVSIDDLPPYEALSYSWDTDTSGQTPHPTIFIDSQPLQIMPNLEAFLLQHRQDQDSPPRPLWIDAICINQNDFTERRQQVGMMSKLYTRLSRLVVWLGSEDEDSRFVIETLKLAACAREEPEYLLQQVQELLASEGHIGDSNYTVQFTAFLKRSWFSRSWVVQEYGFGARRGMVFKCGSLQLRSDEMEAIEALSPENIFSYSNGELKVPATDEYNRSRLFWGTLRLARATVLQAQTCNILYWLSALRGKSATDPRDKIYATLGLAQGNDQKTHSPLYDPGYLIVDYNAPVQDVYSSLVKSVVISTKKLNILLACNERSHHVTRSWVPDWSISDVCEHSGFMGFFYGSIPSIRNALNSSGPEDARVAFADDLSTMTVRGLRWGKVSDTIDIPHLTLDHFLIPRTWLDQRSSPSQRDFVQSLWRTCLIHMEPWESDFLSRYDMLGLYFSQIIEPSTNALRGSGSASYLDLFTPQFKNMMASRNREVLFTTDNGFLGKDFSQQAKIGDDICVLLGCPVPVALRRVGSHYQFIRSVYVDGIMYGEALEALNRGEVEPEDFELH